VTITGATRVRLHPLATRPDGEETIVGRTDTGEFVALPAVGARALDLLAAGATVEETARALRDETGEDVDVADFVAQLLPLGFVAALDDRPVSGPEPIRASLPRLKPAHVRWLLHPATAATALCLIAAAVVLALLSNAPLPSYRSLLWTGTGSLVLLGQFVFGWTQIGLHELAHLATARAAGVPGRVRLGTRLQFLVAQTDVTGIWAAPRRHRLTVHLAGMTCDALTAGAAWTAHLATAPGSLPSRILAAVATTALALLPPQLLLFMRTDVYFVLQDLTGCRNLYADSATHLRHRARRWARRLLRRRPAPADPLRHLPPREARVVHRYAVLLAAGTTVCLGAAVTITIPVDVRLVAEGVRHIVGGTGPRVADGLVTVAVLAAVHLLWARTWWRDHANR
jgi:putative peptide zinc metalloprotease protein